MKFSRNPTRMFQCKSVVFFRQENPIPYIGASPDRILSCSCHESACLEIKCPFSVSHLSPTDEKANLNYLVDTKLKISHQYYTQCQLQMGVTNLKLCYFFVYTAHGFLIDHIEFDDEFYKELIKDSGADTGFFSSTSQVQN